MINFVLENPGVPSRSFNSLWSPISRARRKPAALASGRAQKQTAVEASGWYARILQHEIDHLRGTLYITGWRPARYLARQLESFLEGKPSGTSSKPYPIRLGPIR